MIRKHIYIKFYYFFSYGQAKCGFCINSQNKKVDLRPLKLLTQDHIVIKQTKTGPIISYFWFCVLTTMLPSGHIEFFCCLTDCLNLNFYSKKYPMNPIIPEK